MPSYAPERARNDPNILIDCHRLPIFKYIRDESVFPSTILNIKHVRKQAMRACVCVCARACVRGVLRRFQQSLSPTTTIATCCMIRDSAWGFKVLRTLIHCAAHTHTHTHISSSVHALSILHSFTSIFI